ncbi:MAG: hypothetical protein JNJ69_12760 [Leptospiraceae bacterium]|nr:hypothetical protein [Leptospiraceae bacterium]
MRTFAPIICSLLYFSSMITAQEKPAAIDATKPLPAKQEPTTPATKPTEAATPPVPPATPPAPLTEQEELARKEAELKAIKERELKEQQAREAEARRIEESKTFLDKLFENSSIYTGIHGGLGLALNSLHKTGYGFGMTVDYLAYKHYGFHFGAETGLFPTRAVNLPAGTNTVSVAEGGNYGYLNLNFAAVYALPSLFGFFPAAGAGISIYQLRGGTYDFSQVAAPFFYASMYYPLIGNLQVGFLTNLILPTSAKVTSASSEYKLDSSVAQAALGLQLSVRYAWF